MYKQVDVVMLPTEKASAVIKRNSSLPNDFNIKEGTLQFLKSSEKNIFEIPQWKFQHLYFLSDDEIKDGDWFYDEFSTDKIYQRQNSKVYSLPKGCKKIIATTDEDMCGVEKEYYSNGIFTGGKRQLIYPRPSNEFLKKFCELGGIDKVLVEYDEFTRSESTLDYNNDWIILNNKTIFKTINNEEEYDLTPQLKVAPDNTITIYQI